MRSFERPVVLVSKCLEHDSCRYDGSMIGNSFIKTLKDYVDFVPICPEVAIGMTVPREAVRIVSNNGHEQLVASYAGTEYSKEMETFAKAYVKSLSGKEIHGAILKSRSPSCGVKDVKTYRSTGKVPATGEKTTGFFGREVKTMNIPLEDEGRLSNYNIREHFLTRIYTLADFDKIKKTMNMKELVAFQSKNKYLLMSYHQKEQKILGKIVANHEKRGIEEVYKLYEEHLKISLSRPLRRTTNINMLLHILGYFKEGLNKEEKANFLDVLDQYRIEKMPYLVPLNVLKAWVVRFDEKYLMMQTIFEPFPSSLMDLNDSGKGRV